MQKTPSNIPVDLMEAGVGAPPCEEQRSAIKAFREFIRNPNNRNEFDGGEWTPVRILKKLWQLWLERPNEAGIEKQFYALHYQTVERLRGGGKKRRVDDKLLFILICRFLDLYAVKVQDRADITKIVNSIAHLSAIAPPSRFGPVGDNIYNSGIYTYSIFDPSDTATRFLSLKISATEAAQSACPAIMFYKFDMAVWLGIYCFSHRQAFLWLCSSDEKQYVRIQSEPNIPYTCLQIEFMSNRGIGCGFSYDFILKNIRCAPSQDQRAIEFAQKFMKNV